MQDTTNFEITSSVYKNSSSLRTFLDSFILLTRFLKIHSDKRAKYKRNDIMNILVFSKFFESKSVNDMMSSDLGNILKCGKDVYYSFKNNVKINWRNLLWSNAMQCISKLTHINSKATLAHEIPCLIVDDTDLPKRGKFIEMIGKIFSHKDHSHILGFKCLNLSYWTGKTSILLDFSLHIERRKDDSQGMSKKELKQRYNKERPNDSHGAKRIMECKQKKTDSLIRMLKRAINKGLKAKYLLADSWFFNEKLVKYLSSTSLHLISRPKRNNWKYTYEGKTYTMRGLLKKLKRRKELKKWSRKLKMKYIKTHVEFQGHQMALYFYKPKKRGSEWQILITTHRGLEAVKAYEIYQNRWSIEVSFKELKQHFRYGKCQSRDMVGQISDLTISLMAYNYISMYKCINSYETIGGLFKDVKQSWVQPSVMKRFWEIILNIVSKLSELFSFEVEKFIKSILENNDFLNFFNLNRLISTTET